MHYSIHPEAEEFRPRLIVWQVTREYNSLAEPGNSLAEPGNSLAEHGNSREVLTPNERHLILEGIARTAKPIVVLTGDHLPGRRDIFDLVQYGVALGLKMIVEAKPEDFSHEILRRYVSFGPKIFRVIIDGAVNPGVETRYSQGDALRALETSVKLLRSSGFEIHLSSGINDPDIRQLALQHDYAFRRSASGFYCHLAIPAHGIEDEREAGVKDEIDSYIDAVASLKQFCPPNMAYFSPQCVKYGYAPTGEEQVAGFEPEEEGLDREWRHWCLGGKSFAFITDSGVVRLCAQLGIEDGDMKHNGYDFKKIWETSGTFRRLREGLGSCSQTQEISRAEKSFQS